MKVVIFGSRGISNMREVDKALAHSGVAGSITEVVCGGARGVDTLAQLYAREHALPLKLFIADWEKYGKRAGPMRNMEMAGYADFGIAVWDGYSRGTAHMIGLMQGRVFVWKTAGNAESPIPPEGAGPEAPDTAGRNSRKPAWSAARMRKSWIKRPMPIKQRRSRKYRFLQPASAAQDRLGRAAAKTCLRRSRCRMKMFTF
ncbi:MAG: DUF2493 domain-containing protein [Desulfovibrio sp.]|nr:DUF2493 domain-containing protein [Desulfovibrio sp.]